MRPRLRVLLGGRKERRTKGPRVYGYVRRFKQNGEAVYLTAIMTAPTLYGGGNCA